MTPETDSLTALIDQLRTTYPSLASLAILVSKTDPEFDDALENLFAEAVDDLERNATYLAVNNEDAISAYLAAYLTRTGIRVTKQAHSNGHVDLTIEAELPPYRRRLGEAKIYDGPAYHVKGLEQLVQRYSTGRETLGILVEYVKKPGIKTLVRKTKLHMDQTKPFDQVGTAEDHHHIRWAFTTKHKHSSDEIIRVIHLSCNLYK
jgi:hypothetical protein